MEELINRYHTLNAIREQDMFTHNELEEWIKISTLILYAMLDDKEILMRLK